MASALPHFDPFDIHADGAMAKRWRKWIKPLENLFVAAAITDKKRQRALVLYYAGEGVCEIFEISDVDKEIKSQIILSCSSQRLRRKAFCETTMTLETLFNEARALKISEMQAKDIESCGNANAVLSQPTQKSRAKGNCYNCGESWPHDPKAGSVQRETVNATRVTSMVIMQNSAQPRNHQVKPAIRIKVSSPVDVANSKKNQHNS